MGSSRMRLTDHGSRLQRLLTALWAGFRAAWMPGLFDGYGADRNS